MTVADHLRTHSKSTLPGLVNGPGCSYQIFPEPTRVRFPDVAFTRLERVSS